MSRISDLYLTLTEMGIDPQTATSAQIDAALALLEQDREAARAVLRWAAQRPAAVLTPDLPVIVCLCGSTRFWRTFQAASLAETLAGRIVLSIGAASGTDDEHFGNLPTDEYVAVKARLDDLHLRKIDLANEVLILNVDDYIGTSTRRELAHARAAGKRVRWWVWPSAHALPTEEPAHPAEVQAAAGQGESRCVNCGASPDAPGDAYCWSCGFELRVHKAAAAQEETP